MCKYSHMLYVPSDLDGRFSCCTIRVQTSDMSICVLSLDETLSCASAGPSNFGAVTLTLPDDVLSFVTPDTMFLFNKLDLTQQSSGSSSADHGLLSREKELRNEIKKALRRALPPFPFACEGGQVQRAQGGPHVWTVSLRSGEGTSDFIQGLASALKNRVACVVLSIIHRLS